MIIYFFGAGFLILLSCEEKDFVKKINHHLILQNFTIIITHLSVINYHAKIHLNCNGIAGVYGQPEGLSLVLNVRLYS